MADLVRRTAVVMPAYNEASVLGPLLREVREVFPHVVVVDDGSDDGTAAVAVAAGAVALRHGVNVGQGAALETGLRYAVRQGFPYVVTMDADGQHRPEDALALVRHLDERRAELDLVLGSRFLGTPRRSGRLRALVLRAAARVSSRLHGLPLTDVHNGLRAFTGPVAQAVRFRHVDMAHASELYDIIRRHGFRFAEHPVDVRYTAYSRRKGQPLANAVNILVDLLAHRR